MKVHRQKKEGSDASIWPCDIGLGEGGLEGGGRRPLEESLLQFGSGTD